MFLFTDLFPLSFDQPASIGNIKISRFSNWYHFNKVESHFLGLEYQLINNDLFNIYSQGGYSFERKKFSYSFINRYKGLTLEVKNQVINIGGFDYNKTGQSLSALFSHKDDMHYYQSTNFVATYNHDLFSKLNAKIDLKFEQQKPLKKTTDFSFFSRNKIYSPNYLIHRYNNNKAGITLNYIENHDYYIKRPILYHGESFTNLSISYYYQNERMLKATEDRAILNLKLHRFQPIIYPMSVDFKLIWHKQDKSDYNQMSNFTSKMNSFFEFESDLSFYSLDNYEYYINDYLKLHNDVTLFNFPEIYNVKMSFGGLVSYLKPLRTTKFDTEFFKVLEKEFWEYGIVIKGISIFNLYLITNNFQNNVVNFQLKMYL